MDYLRNNRPPEPFYFWKKKKNILLLVNSSTVCPLISYSFNKSLYTSPRSRPATIIIINHHGKNQRTAGPVI